MSDTTVPGKGFTVFRELSCEDSLYRIGMVQLNGNNGTPSLVVARYDADDGALRSCQFIDGQEGVVNDPAPAIPARIVFDQATLRPLDGLHIIFGQKAGKAERYPDLDRVRRIELGTRLACTR